MTSENKCAGEFNTGLSTERNWLAFAAAIVVQAINDYEIALNKNDVNGIDGIKALEKFFSSEWCNFLISMCIGLDCEYKDGEITERVRKAIASKEKKGVFVL